jgi:hypothetical protein
VSAGIITAFNSATSLTVSTSQTVSAQAYTINYPGLNVNSAGNVGVGTALPQANLDVYSAAGVGAIDLGGQNGISVPATDTTSLAVGPAAMSSFNPSSGAADVAVGNLAMYYNTTGSHDTAVGYAALYGTTGMTGSGNTAVGWASVGHVTTGGQNTGLGESAAGAMTSGSSNTAVGDQALYSDQTGTANTAIGNYALWGTTTGHNTALGNNAGYAMTSGTENVVIGDYTNTASHGGVITSGSNNIVIGQDVGYGLTATSSNQLDIGNLIYATGLGSGIAGLSGGSVGIGTASPQAPLDVAGEIKVAGTGSETCDSTHVGAMRYNSSTGLMQICFAH